MILKTVFHISQHFKFNLGDIEIKLNDIKVLLNNKAENTEKSNYVDLKNKKNGPEDHHFTNNRHISVRVASNHDDDRL